MDMRKVILLGSTGSIGSQVLDVIRLYPDEFHVIGISAYENTALLETQAREFKPKYIVQTGVSENPQQALMALAETPEADFVVNAISGSAGLMPTYAACKAGKKIASANKESLVMAGELLMKLCKETGAEIIPIDSELSAVWQMLKGNRQPSQSGTQQATGNSGIEKVILTASGGPFWKWRRKELEKVTVEQTLKHPTWKMGEKVSIDSATLINKAFEIIATRWLFDIPHEKIDITIHRQSIVHALLQFTDGNTLAVMSRPDMRIVIEAALFYPERRQNTLPRLDFSELQLTFEKPDCEIFEGHKLAYDVLKEGGIMPAVFCLADEIAVNKFLEGELSFLGIYDFIKRALERVKNMPLSLETLKAVQIII